MVCQETESRADYFLKLVHENTYISQPLSEKELVDCLIFHFDNEMRRGIRNNALHGIDEIEEFLRSVDDTFIRGSYNRGDRGPNNRNNDNQDNQNVSRRDREYPRRLENNTVSNKQLI